MLKVREIIFVHVVTAANEERATGTACEILSLFYVYLTSVTDNNIYYSGGKRKEKLTVKPVSLYFCDTVKKHNIALFFFFLVEPACLLSYPSPETQHILLTRFQDPDLQDHASCETRSSFFSNNKSLKLSLHPSFFSSVIAICHMLKYVLQCANNAHAI